MTAYLQFKAQCKSYATNIIMAYCRPQHTAYFISSTVDKSGATVEFKTGVVLCRTTKTIT
jgi:hypothetical protein